MSLRALVHVTVASRPRPGPVEDEDEWLMVYLVRQAKHLRPLFVQV